MTKLLKRFVLWARMNAVEERLEKDPRNSVLLKKQEQLKAAYDSLT